ncbi:hypothetical protein ZIOFF_009498 [Zingiber officinale]|uniref:Uncharacterized protein n=1 Tax=Zingiber officinale TaxID=94328 RepID=A0A8J5HL20_ZINOF|nr:hypothetical protein ZIOFF_009498 [Zingiber officinale]
MTSAPPLDASSAQSQRQHQILPPKKPQTKSATLIFDEISKLFSLPIAEAAPILATSFRLLFGTSQRKNNDTIQERPTALFVPDIISNPTAQKGDKEDKGSSSFSLLFRRDSDFNKVVVRLDLGLLPAAGMASGKVDATGSKRTARSCCCPSRIACCPALFGRQQGAVQQLRRQWDGQLEGEAQRGWLLAAWTSGATRVGSVSCGQRRQGEEERGEKNLIPLVPLALGDGVDGKDDVDASDVFLIVSLAAMVLCSTEEDEEDELPKLYLNNPLDANVVNNLDSNMVNSYLDSNILDFNVVVNNSLDVLVKNTLDSNLVNSSLNYNVVVDGWFNNHINWAEVPLLPIHYALSEFQHLVVDVFVSTVAECVAASALANLDSSNDKARGPLFLAGKTVDDIRRDVAKERPEILDVSKTTNQRNLVSKVISSPSGSLSTSTGYPAQDPPKMQQVSLTVNASPQGNRFIQNGLPMNQSKHIPTFMDEFKYGFPTNGLSSHSVKWWGVSGHEDADGSLPGETAVEKDENQEMQELSNDDEDPDSGAEDNDAESKPSALLCSLRRKAVDYGRESLGIGIPNRLTKKQKLTLTQVFGSSLTESWSINFS